MYESLFSNVPVKDKRNLKRYLTLIEHYVNNPHTGSGEEHHILPKALGGRNGPVVLLPNRAHFIAHWMLHKAIGKGMTVAFHFMVHQGTYKNRITSRVYDVLREDHREWQTGKKFSAETRKKIGDSKIGKPLSEEHKESIRQTKTGTKMTDETKQKMSKSASKPKTEEHSKNISKSRKGMKFSDEHKENMSKAVKGRMWFNDGVKSYFRHTPEPNWNKGRLYARS